MLVYLNFWRHNDKCIIVIKKYVLVVYFVTLNTVSYTHLTLPTIYSV